MKKLDVMYFIYQEMYLCIQDKQKAPIYAPYVTRLIKNSGASYPLITTNLVTHKQAKPQRKIITYTKEKVVAAPYVSSAQPRVGARRKNATPPSSSRTQREIIEEEVEKSSFMSKMFMCMCLSIRRTQYGEYKDKRKSNKRLNEKLQTFVPIKQRSPTPSQSSHTMSFGEWNRSQDCPLP